MCNEAADEIYRLNAERDSLQQRLVALEDEKNAYIDYVGDALGQDDNESLWDAAQRVLSERDRLRSENEALRAMASDLISEINDHPETLEAHDLLAIISAALGEQR
jgi:seryl-tRNA synthetase